MKISLILFSFYLLTAQNIFSQEYNIQPVMELKLAEKLGQLRAVPVKIGNEHPHAIAVMYSEEAEVDPWEGMFFFPKHTLKLSVLTVDGELLWTKDLGSGVVPGIWFSPLFAFDLDGDGTDELWIINNRDPEHPLNYRHYVLEKLDPATGELMAEMPWPAPEIPQTLSALYRHFIMGGYVNGEPVLLTAQGTYGPMRIQAWNSDLSRRWEHYIPADAPGAQGSHVSPVVDINNNGVDALFWGERLIELDTGEQLFCADEDTWEGHSDIIQPVFDYDNEKWYFFTCRENFDRQAPRVAMYDAEGQRIWGDLENGHIDTGWAARLGDNGEPYVLGVKVGKKTRTAEGETRTEVTEYAYKAFSGEPVDFGFDLYTTIPVDLNGDGIHELVKGYFEGTGDIIDRKGNVLANIGGLSAMACKFTPRDGEQILSYSKDGWIRIWADLNARDNYRARNRYNNPFYKMNRIQTGNGYNLFNLGGI
jgi:WD40 repeat protein